LTLNRPLFAEIGYWDEIQARVVLYAPRVGMALLVLFVFWLISRGVRRVIERMTKVRRLDPDVTRYLGQAARAALMAFGVITALGTLGVDVGALVAGLGLTGFALGFALKDIISNALSGMLVLFYHPFRIGDRISVSGLEGLVTDINLRYTVLEGEGKRMLIPSSMLFSNPVTVLSSGLPHDDTPA
jgi:small-conductance mechanosensitive channel